MKLFKEPIIAAADCYPAHHRMFAFHLSLSRGSRTSSWFRSHELKMFSDLLEWDTCCGLYVTVGVKSA